MSRTRARRDIELFNFSFLDILACVIGLLIFILTIVAVSGGRAVPAVAAGLSQADQSEHAAAGLAQQAANRRSQLETMLSQRAIDAADPAKALATIESEISVLHEQVASIAAATESARRQAAEAQSSSDALRKDASAANATDQLRGEVVELNQQTSAINQQTAQIRAQPLPAPKHVLYYIPHLRETDRKAVWIEVSGSQFWLLDDDYTDHALNDRDTEFSRNDGAIGHSIADLIQGKSTPPSTLTTTLPQDTVIMVLVRPDGFEGYRKFREWAWSKKYAVNWVPMGQDEPIIMTHVSRIFQQ